MKAKVSKVSKSMYSGRVINVSQHEVATTLASEPSGARP
jgi:hypothetical protein